MEIPFTAKPRQDTGLYNAKLGIWLFLASEVMLFGALFSSYIVLRLGADAGMWPHGLMNIPIGTFNTAVLIISSVTVVLAWSYLKLGDFKKYKFFQSITLLCAAGFVGIKSFEYREKWHHYEVWFKEPLTLEQQPGLAGHAFHADNERRQIRQGQIPSLIGHFNYGHHEHAGYFWTLGTLKEKKITEIEFQPDQFHYRIPARIQAEMKKDGKAPEKPAPIKIKVEDIKRLSAFVPAHSTFFAIYFTLTFLHALHVVGGAIVIAWIWGPGAALWKTDPERYTNRVEVSGLFWHFVDLVWIFLFPILYLL